MSVAENNWDQDQNQGSNQNQNENQNQGQNQGQNSNQNQNQNQFSGQDSRPNSGTGQNTAPFQITGNWGQQSSQLKNKYSQLTDSDLDFRPGQENELMDQIGTRLNKSRDEVNNILNEFNNSNQQNQNQNQNQQGQNQNQNQSNRNQSDKGQFNEDEPDKFTL